MEELLFTAEPVKNYSILIMLIGALVTLLIFLFLVQNNKIKKIKKVYRQLTLLLGGLAIVIIFATTIFTIWNLQTIQSVKLYETYMETYQGKTLFKNIKRAGIFNDRERSFINPQMVVRENNILVVEKIDKSVILFAEENYDIQELVKRIHEQMKQ